MDSRGFKLNWSWINVMYRIPSTSAYAAFLDDNTFLQNAERHTGFFFNFQKLLFLWGFSSRPKTTDLTRLVWATRAESVGDNSTFKMLCGPEIPDCLVSGRTCRLRRIKSPFIRSPERTLSRAAVWSVINGPQTFPTLACLIGPRKPFSGWFIH